MNPDYKIPVIGFILMTGLLGFGIFLWYAIDTSTDLSILHNQIMNNQTFVDEMPCKKITLTQETLRLMISPTQQDMVEQLKIDFDKLYENKKCDTNP